MLLRRLRWEIVEVQQGDGCASEESVEPDQNPLSREPAQCVKEVNDSRSPGLIRGNGQMWPVSEDLVGETGEHIARTHFHKDASAGRIERLDLVREADRLDDVLDQLRGDGHGVMRMRSGCGVRKHLDPRLAKLHRREELGQPRLRGGHNGGVKRAGDRE
jgi:hypothetical protein